MRLLNKIGAGKSVRKSDHLRQFRQEIESKLKNYKYIFAEAPPPAYTSLEKNGQKIWVIGSQPINFYSSNVVLERLDKLLPNVICLSDLHPKSHLDYIHYSSPSQCINPNFPYRDTDLPIKEKFFSFFENAYHKNLYFFHNDAGTFFLAEPYTKSCFNDDALSAANWAYLERNCGLVASGAHPFMIHEDLCHSLSLDRLREIFHLVVEEYVRRAKALGRDPLTMPMEVYEKIYNIVKADYIEEFYLKRTQYSASVVQKVSKSFKRTVAVHYDFHVELMEKELYSDQEEWQEIMKSKSFDGSIDELIEKIVILSHLDNKIIRNWIEYGHDPIQYMFKGQFKYPVEELKAAFDYYNSYYKDVLTKALIEDIKRIPFMSDRGRQVENFSESIKKIEARKGEYVVGYYQNAIIDKMKCQMLQKQILKNIQKKLDQGINQTDELLALEQVTKGENTGFTVEVLMRLITEANSQLKIMKLPKEFRRFEDQLFSRVTLDSFYAYMKNVKLPSFKERDPKLQVEDDGRQVMMVGPGEIPEELKGKSIKEIQKMDLEKVYESPMDMYDGKPMAEDPKVWRERMKTFDEFYNKD